MNKIEIENAKPLFSWCPDIEASALEQAKNIAKLPYVEHLALMPDSHQGMTAPIGSVVACKEVIVPCFIGSDCGCGMGAIRTNLKKSDFELKAIRKQIHDSVDRRIPQGFAHNDDTRRKEMKARYGEKIDFLFENFTPTVAVAEVDDFFSQLGTLGGGNHYIEIQYDENGDVWIMLHSGSRNIGKVLCEYYDEIAQKLNAKWHSKSNVGFLPVDSIEGKEYLKWMNIALRFAFLNRDAMLKDMLAVLENYFPQLKITTKAAIEGWTEGIINIHHNYAALENHLGKNVYVHRKGATLASAKTIGIIPGSQYTNSYITKGLGNPLSLNSSSHGAGRKMGRKQFNVQNQNRVADIEAAMEAKGIEFTPFKKSTRGKDEGMYDISEAGDAYKDIENIMCNQADLVQPLYRLSPIINWKG